MSGASRRTTSPSSTWISSPDAGARGAPASLATRASRRLSIDAIRPTYRFDETCQGTVPQALIAFLESASFEDAIRNAISLGGDADTLACITGGIAEAFYGGVPDEIASEVRSRLHPDLLKIVDQFRASKSAAAWN